MEVVLKNLYFWRIRDDNGIQSESRFISKYLMSAKNFLRNVRRAIFYGLKLDKNACKKKPRIHV